VTALPENRVRRVLNVGGGNKTIPIPPHYDGWEHVLLDVDSRGDPDIVCDARELDSLPAGQFDAVYCSHNLEHYYRHDGAKVLRGFLHVLKPHGFAEVRVPDLECVMRRVVKDNMGIADVLYQSGAGPISVQDVIYGLGTEIEQSGSDFYAHKTGFTPKSLGQTLTAAGFGGVFLFVAPEIFETRALAFKQPPTEEQQQLLHLPRA
jgi:SAM-dependent methyltransferase